MNKNFSVYEDLVGKNVYTRLYNEEHAEWELCRVLKLCRAGLKVKSSRTNSIHIIGNADVSEDVRVVGAFVPWEKEQKPYDGVVCVFFITLI